MKRGKSWHWWLASAVLEGLAGAAMLAGYRSQALARNAATWDVVSDKPETAEGAKDDGVSRDDS